MPGRFFLTGSIADLGSRLGVSAGPLANQPPRRNIAPGQEIVVYDGTLRLMRWGIIPVGRKNARGRPVMETIVNARSETVFEKAAFEGVARAVIPVNGWYEWTGETRRKTAWAISSKDGGWLFFAAITDVWTAPGGSIDVPQVAALTCAPNADVSAIHHRMGVLLEAEDIPDWLGPDIDRARALMRPWPDGRLKIEKAADVDWSAP